MGAIGFKRAAGAMALAGFLAALPQQARAQLVDTLPTINVTDSRLGRGIIGASTSIITAEEIERTPAESLQEILSRQPGVQTWSTFGAVNGARTVIDIRGFGAAAPANTLVLIDGRRLTDVDLAGVDLAAIPRQSIERIEITRGNSGAVLYGDNAVGGVINIVTKKNVGAAASARVEAAFGSFGQKEGSASVHGSSGGWTASAYGNAINSDGYRENNEYRQRNGIADIRYTDKQGSAFVTLSADDQKLGLPGARRFDPAMGINQLVTDRRGATTPDDYADKQGLSATAGFTRMLNPSTELIVDGGVRWKGQQAAALLVFQENYLDTTLMTTSVTPRVINQHVWWGMPGRLIAGVDYYNADFNQDRGRFKGEAPIHRYDLKQQTLAGYAQETLAVRPDTDVSFGGRVEWMKLSARDDFDVNAPGGISFGFPTSIGGIPLDMTDTNYALHVGFEHRINPNLALFGRMARSFRTPNVDERVSMVPSFPLVPTTFDLNAQTTHDMEIGLRGSAGPLEAQWSIYDMRLENEIHYSPATSTNTNLDPTRRWGHETSVVYHVSDALRLTGGYAYTNATFRDGPFAGNEVPLVSKHTGSVGLAWDIWQKYLTFDGVVRYVGSRRMDNDQVNLQPLIPSFATIDVRLGGQLDQFFWSVSVLNLFNEEYFDYAIASAYPYGPGSRLNVYNAYPQPGRTFLVRAGVKW
jgi:iron complex outermembrane receptor protein